MQSDSLVKYIHNSGDIDPQLYDNLRYVLESQVYYYGNHFLYPQEKKIKPNSVDKIKALFRMLYAYYKYASKRSDVPEKNVLSNAYFTFNRELQKIGYNVFDPCWSFTKSDRSLLGNRHFYRSTIDIRKKVFNSAFSYLVSSEFADEYHKFRNELKDIIVSSKIEALFVPNDVSFFENLSINVFKELKKPSFIFLHGLPGRYNNIDENRTDYLIVWGNRIKEQYIAHGFSPDKILVGGHPFYQQLTTSNLKSDLSNVLVLAKVGVGSPHSDGMVLYDRGNQITYLLQIQKALQSQGVKKVRLRFHPSANPAWHFQFIDKTFFELDTLPLNASLSNASMVIGPTSTVFLESIYHGVNYLTFEPGDNSESILNEPLKAPFDGKEDGVPFASNIVALEKLIKDNVKVDIAVFNNYIKTPFDIGFIKAIT